MKKLFVAAVIVVSSITSAAGAAPVFIEQIGPNVAAMDAGSSVSLSNLVMPNVAMAASLQSARETYGGAKGSIALVSQTGSDHLLHIEQIGNGNIGLITQGGMGNAAALIQTGNNNVGLISQLGYGNSVRLTQSGANHGAVVTQQGRGNVAIISQR
jgi:hypothetical protein